MQHQILINVIIFVAYVLNLPLNTQRSHSRSQRAGKWSLILAHDRRPIYRAPTYIAVPLLGPHQPRYIGLTLYLLIVPFHKSQDTLLHPGLNDQIQNTLFTEDPHETRALWGWFDWLPGSAYADLNWSALVNHIGIHPLPATQPTLIGHALYIKPRPSQFSVPHAPPCMHGNGEIFVCNI